MGDDRIPISQIVEHRWIILRLSTTAKHGKFIVVTRLGVAIPTLNAGQRWLECLAALGRQSLRPAHQLVIDSASTDDTVVQAKAAGLDVIGIARADFNHGGTRQFAVERLQDCEIIVFLTQDAVMANSEALSELVRCFEDPQVAVAYGRQLPHVGASPIESHARLFSYGAQTQKKDIAALPELGASVFFCSNSFAAYRRSMLMELGGFRNDLILGEDAEFAARAIKAGYANVYCASAVVYHSHDYKLKEIFWRYFDTGVFHARSPWMRADFGSYNSKGMRFVRSELRYLATHAPLQIPRAMCHSIAKFLGYRLGRREKIIPNRVKRWLSMSPSYWKAQSS
jgi:rhamnosyltransferase